MSSALAVRDLFKSHARRGLAPVDVLRGLDLAVEPGRIVAVMGVSGSGKSTLLHVLGGMLAPDAGSIRLGDDEPWSMTARDRAAWRNARVGFVFQHHGLLTELSALENVLAPAWIGGASESEARPAARRLLEDLGLGPRATHYPTELSGGEAQRVAIARALVRSPALVLADEPTGNLDRQTGSAVFDEFLALQRRQAFVALVATHDDRLAERCDHVLRLEEGRVVPS